MFFTISINSAVKKDFLRSDIINTARKRIRYYKISANERKLDTYLLKNYKKRLKSMCFELLSHASILFSDDMTATISFIDKKYDKIALIITYGNGIFQGSGILRNAFEWGDKRWL